MAVVSRRRDTGGGGSERYYQQPLIATANPRIFLSPIKFKHTTTDKESVFYNGMRQTSAKHYNVQESGGPGTGYDTVVLVADPAVTADWTIDFSPA